MARDFNAACVRAKELRNSVMSYDAIAKRLSDEGYRRIKGGTVWDVGIVYRMCRGDFDARSK